MSQLLGTRLFRHKGDVADGFGATAMAPNTLDTGYIFNFSNTEIVG